MVETEFFFITIAQTLLLFFFSCISAEVNHWIGNLEAEGLDCPGPSGRPMVALGKGG